MNTQLTRDELVAGLVRLADEWIQTDNRSVLRQLGAVGR
jgi:hypothetical protein